jgi:hypothetical protein
MIIFTVDECRDCRKLHSSPHLPIEWPVPYGLEFGKARGHLTDTILQPTSIGFNSCVSNTLPRPKSHRLQI